MKWFRFYHEILLDTKVLEMSHSTFRVWVLLMCIANQHKVRGQFPDNLNSIKQLLKCHANAVKAAIKYLESVNIIVHVPENNTYKFVNWDKRQFLSDSSTARTRAWRERHGDVSVTVGVTPPDTDTESEYKDSSTELVKQGLKQCTKCTKTFKPIYENHELCMDCFKKSQGTASSRYLECANEKCGMSGPATTMRLDDKGICQYCRWIQEANDNAK